jgi:hypothetical protein
VPFPLRFLSWFEHYSRRFAADQTRYCCVWFASLLNADTTVDAWIDKAFTMPADQTAIFGWQSDSRSHGNSAGNRRVALSQLWFLSYILLCQFEERSNMIQSHLASFIHP